MEQRSDTRHQHQHTYQAVDHRGNARQQADSGFHHRLHLCRGQLGQIHRREEAHRHTKEDGPRRTVDAGEDKGQDAEGRFFRRGFPGVPQQEVQQADLPDGGDAGQDQIYRNQQDAAHCDQPQEKKDPVDQLFYKTLMFSHKLCLLMGRSGGRESRCSMRGGQFAATAPALLMRGAASAEVAKSKNAWAASDNLASVFVTSTKGRWMA